MKKLIVFIFIVAIIACLNLSIIKMLTLTEIFGNAPVEVFVQEFADEKFASIKNGNYKIVFCTLGDLDYILNSGKVFGFTIKVTNFCKEQILNKIGASVTKVNSFGVYGSSYLLAKTYNLWCNGNNFQVAQVANSIHIGCPVLLGGY